MGSWTQKAGQRPVTPTVVPVPDNGAGKEDTREECPQCGKKYKDLQNHLARVHAPVPPSDYPFGEFQWMFDVIASAFGKKWGPAMRSPNAKQYLRAKKWHEAQQP